MLFILLALCTALWLTIGIIIEGPADKPAVVSVTLLSLYTLNFAWRLGHHCWGRWNRRAFKILLFAITVAMFVQTGEIILYTWRTEGLAPFVYAAVAVAGALTVGAVCITLSQLVRRLIERLSRHRP